MRTFYFLCCCILLTSISWSQDQKTHEQIRSLKLAHLASELNLTAQEADKFWPLYATYNSKIYQIRHSDKVRFIHKTDIEQIRCMSELDAKNTLDELNKYEQDYFAVRSKFNEDALKIISVKKLILLKKAEDDFNRKLLKQYKKKK